MANTIKARISYGYMWVRKPEIIDSKTTDLKEAHQIFQNYVQSLQDCYEMTTRPSYAIINE